MDFIYLCYPFPTVNHRELTTPEVYPATQEYTKKGAIPFVDHFQIRCFDPETVDRIWPWQELPFSKWNRNQTVRWCWIWWSFSFIFEDSHRKHPIRRGSILTPLIFSIASMISLQHAGFDVFFFVPQMGVSIIIPQGSGQTIGPDSPNRNCSCKKWVHRESSPNGQTIDYALPSSDA